MYPKLARRTCRRLGESLNNWYQSMGASVIYSWLLCSSFVAVSYRPKHRLLLYVLANVILAHFGEWTRLPWFQYIEFGNLCSSLLDASSFVNLCTEYLCSLVPICSTSTAHLMEIGSLARRVKHESANVHTAVMAVAITYFFFRFIFYILEAKLTTQRNTVCCVLWPVLPARSTAVKQHAKHAQLCMYTHIIPLTFLQRQPAIHRQQT